MRLTVNQTAAEPAQPTSGVRFSVTCKRAKMDRINTAVSAFLSTVAFISLTLSSAICVSAQDVRGTVRVDSLSVYGGMSAQDDPISALPRGTVVHITMSVTNGEGAWCSVASIDPEAKIGYVRCDGLERQSPPNTAASPGGQAAQQSLGGVELLTRAQKEWALAASAVLTERNHQRHDTLAGVALNDQQRQFSRQTLQAWWNVGSRDELLAALAWIDQGGHRQEFAALGARTAQVPADQLKAVLVRLNPEDANSILVAQRYYGKLGDKSLIGWDYSRYISICRIGYTAGYLQEDEAWPRIIYAARILQSSFSSWQELGENYLIGRQFWSLAETRNSGAAIQAAYSRLLNNPGSPWNRIPWNLALQ